MFKNFLLPLWRDDRGAIISSEWVAVTGAVTIPAVGGVAVTGQAVRDAAHNQAEMILRLGTPDIEFKGYGNRAAQVGGVSFHPKFPAPKFVTTVPNPDPVQ